MKILKENIDELLMKTKYITKNQYKDIKLNTFLNYWIFFDKKETNETPRSKLRGISPRLTSFVISLLRCKHRGMYPPGIQELTNESLEVILYSKYYWCSKYKDRYTALYGQDVGIEQQQYKIIEEIEQRITDDINWNFIQLLEENNL